MIVSTNRERAEATARELARILGGTVALRGGWPLAIVGSLDRIPEGWRTGWERGAALAMARGGAADEKAIHVLPPAGGVA